MMSVRMIVLARRKPGLSPADFRAGYEGSHSRIAVRLFGHLWTAYSRNYLGVGRNFDGRTGGPDDIGLDVVSEYVLRDDTALDEMHKIMSEHMELIKEDEARWFDQARSWVMVADRIRENLPTL
ncbi:hypothetical protein DM806_17295 [Sphingobium lactosutens]|uniref:EthD domain-containing protein n=1 Tax=Sphingobium lactosutens TaxID=522773 RepID=UPI0015C15AD6|nr:EthD domain-containing protein [Sphingobium lactosutens]NWK97389.1 hypothetical protein [Sphingobium lactosutens]